MLVLTRKVGERIIVGTDIDITVLAARGRRVRLGVSAPPDMPILRPEVLQSSNETVQGYAEDNAARADSA